LDIREILEWAAAQTVDEGREIPDESTLLGPVIPKKPS
jgi:hypothetical protein